MLEMAGTGRDRPFSFDDVRDSLGFQSLNPLVATEPAWQKYQMPDRIRTYDRDAGRGDDRFWAVIATIGRVVRIADVHTSHDHALADQLWREQQVRAYLGFLQRCQQPVPRYTVRSMNRSHLPRGWRPLPALGFLNGHMA